MSLEKNNCQVKGRTITKVCHLFYFFAFYTNYFQPSTFNCTSETIYYGEERCELSVNVYVFHILSMYGKYFQIIICLKNHLYCHTTDMLILHLHTYDVNTMNSIMTGNMWHYWKSFSCKLITLYIHYWRKMILVTWECILISSTIWSRFKSPQHGSENQGQ